MQPSGLAASILHDELDDGGRVGQGNVSIDCDRRARVSADDCNAAISACCQRDNRLVAGPSQDLRRPDFTVDPARVRKPKDKARVERTVRFVREDCFGGEVLSSLEAAHVRALPWAEHEAGMHVVATTRL